MIMDSALRAQLVAVFERLNTAAAAKSFPPPAALSTALKKLIPKDDTSDRNIDANVASCFASAAIDIWLRSIHSFLVSASLTEASPIWSSVSGYYSSHYAVRGLAHLLGYFQLYPYALRTRKSAGLMTRKLSVTESQKTAQFFGTSVRRKCRTDRQKSL